MRTLLAAIATLGLLTLPAMAAPTAEQKTEFHRVCMSIAQDEALCSCKADAAMTLIDEPFMAMVIAAMQGGSVPQDEYRAYNAYVAKSNQVCKPNY
jgi:hypothetical protein